VNVGGVRNRGRELAVRLNIINGEAAKGAFRWTTGVNYAMNKNWVESLGGDQELQAARAADDLSLNGTITRVGEPLGVFYGYKSAGILRDSAAAASYTKLVKPLSGTSWKPGDLAIADVNGDSVITSADRTIIGNPAPKYTFGWTNNVGWKRFELATTVDGAYGARLLNLNLARLESGSPRTNMLADVWTDRWTPENPDAKYPRIGGAQLFIGSDITSDMLEDGSYTRLRAVTLTYNVPPAWLGRTGLGMARIYVTGTNLATWTNYSGFNPDVSSISIGNVNRGIDVGSYPLAKAVTFGLNLSY
jgi:TonB-dependent starch-binding outer membrane protein SusC